MILKSLRNSLHEDRNNDPEGLLKDGQMFASGGFICGKGDAPKLDSAVLPDSHFEDLVSEIAILLKLVENKFEKLPLDVEVQTEGSIDAHKSGMQAHVRVFSGGSRLIRWPAKVDAVIRNERPVSFENDSLQFPVLRACFSKVIHMRTNKAPLLGVGRQRGAQIFINQYSLQTPSLLKRSHEAASWKPR